MAVITQKKRGRPAGTRNKHVPTAESVRAEWMQRYSEMTAYYENAIKSLESGVRNLEHQAIGYRSVVSYLENKIEQLIANSVRGN